MEQFVAFKVNVNVPDINGHTPLHEAARRSTWDDDEKKKRIECIKSLLKNGADVNALTNRRESPLLMACRHGSREVVKHLLRSNADLLHTNVDGYNCLEMAIKEKNEDVVKYLIDNENIFQLMCNAQLIRPECSALCRRNNDNNENCVSSCYTTSDKRSNCCLSHCYRWYLDSVKVDTPMRKLIRYMPDMAYRVLSKCVTTVGFEKTKLGLEKTTLGIEKSKLHRKFFNYEFLEDHFDINSWGRGKKTGINSSFIPVFTCIHRDIEH